MFLGCMAAAIKSGLVRRACFLLTPDRGVEKLAEEPELVKCKIFLPSSPGIGSEIIKLIKQLKLNKAPEYEIILAEDIQNNLDWWVPILAFLFTYIDKCGKVSDDWGLPLVASLFKKEK